MTRWEKKRDTEGKREGRRCHICVVQLLSVSTLESEFHKDFIQHREMLPATHTLEYRKTQQNCQLTQSAKKLKKYFIIYLESHAESFGLMCRVEVK